jgi:hypothetical protein
MLGICGFLWSSQPLHCLFSVLAECMIDSPAITDVQLKARVEEILQSHNLNYILEWSDTCVPYETPPGGELVEEARSSVQDVMGYPARPCTSGGTSDGRFVAAAFPNCQIVELGLLNKSIHKVDEHVAVVELEQLSNIYHRLLMRLLLLYDTKRSPDENYGIGAHSGHIAVQALP